MKNTSLMAGFCALALWASPQMVRADQLILTASPLYSLPLGAPADVLTPLSLGGSFSANLPLPLFGLSWLHPVFGAGYVYSGITRGGSLMAIEGQAGLAARILLTPLMDLTAALSVRGVYYILDSTATASSFSPGAALDAGADFHLGDSFSFGAGAQGVYDLGMYFTLRPYLSGSLRLSAKATPAKDGLKPRERRALQRRLPLMPRRRQAPLLQLNPSSCWPTVCSPCSTSTTRITHSAQ